MILKILYNSGTFEITVIFFAFGEQCQTVAEPDEYKSVRGEATGTPVYAGSSVLHYIVGADQRCDPF